MDDLQAFMELSAVLTGLPSIANAQDKPLRVPIAAEYARLLRGVFADRFDKLIALYKLVAAGDPKSRGSTTRSLPACATVKISRITRSSPSRSSISGTFPSSSRPTSRPRPYSTAGSTNSEQSGHCSRRTLSDFRTSGPAIGRSRLNPTINPISQP